MRYENQTLSNQEVVLDGNEYMQCTFADCQITYRGGALPKLVGNAFRNCSWTFDDAASRTVQFMTALYHGGGQEVVELTLDRIRKPDDDKNPVRLQ